MTEALSENHLCLICNKPAVSVSIDDDRTNTQEIFQLVSECMEVNFASNNDSCDSSVQFCSKCKTAVEEWKHCHDQEIKFKLRASQVKTLLISQLIQSCEGLREQSQCRSSLLFPREQIRWYICNQYVEQQLLETVDGQSILEAEYPVNCEVKTEYGVVNGGLEDVAESAGHVDGRLPNFDVEETENLEKNIRRRKQSLQQRNTDWETEATPNFVQNISATVQSQSGHAVIGTPAVVVTLEPSSFLEEHGKADKDAEPHRRNSSTDESAKPETYKYLNFPWQISGDEVVTCLTCSKDFKGKNADVWLRKHIRLVHLGNGIQMQDVEEIGPGQYKYKNLVPFTRVNGNYACGLCKFRVITGEPVYKWNAMRRHMNKHHMGPPESQTVMVEELVEASGQRIKYKYLGVYYTVFRNKCCRCEACSKTYKGGYIAKYRCKQHIRTAHAGPWQHAKITTLTSSESNRNRRETPRCRERRYKTLGIPYSYNNGKYTCGACSKSYHGPNGRGQCKGHIYGHHKGLLKWAKAVTETAEGEYLYLKEFPFFAQDGGSMFRCGMCQRSVTASQRRVILLHLAGHYAVMLDSLAAPAEAAAVEGGQNSVSITEVITLDDDSDDDVIEIVETPSMAS